MCTGAAVGQAICIPKAIQSSVAEGTVYFGSEKQPLPGVRVEIAGSAYGAPVIASSMTGKDGRFSLAGVKRGRYLLSAKHPSVGYLTAEFEIRSRWFRHHNRSLVIVIGDDPLKGACWGGYAKTVEAVGRV